MAKNWKQMEYQDLDKGFKLPKGYDPNKQTFYHGVKRIPRKLKKKIKAYMGCHYAGASVGERLWYDMGRRCPDYRRFVIKKTCEKSAARSNKTVTSPV